MKAWIEEREEGDKLKKGTGIFVLRHADHKEFPYAVLTRSAFSVLGELLCVCSERLKAQEIVDAINNKPQPAKEE